MSLKTHSTAALTLAALLSACGGDDGGGAQPPAPTTDAGTTPDAADAPDAAPPPERDAAPTDAAPDAEPVPVGACGAVRVVDFTAETALIEGDTWTLETESDPAGESTLEGACGGGNGAEIALRFVTPEAGTWRVLVTPADPDAEFDTVLYAREGCLDPETELDCNDDFDYPARTDSRVVFDAEAGAEVFLIVDAYAGASDPRGGAVRVEARRLTEVARGGACDPLGLEDTCAVGDFCFASPDVNEAPVCAESTPPVATSGRATLLDTQLGLTVEGTDTSRNAEGAYVTLYQGDTVMTLLDGTEAAGLIIEPLEGVSIFGLETFTFQSAADLAEVLGDAVPDRVEVTLFDTELEESAPLSLPVGVAETLALGAPCDAARLHDRCAEGTACRDASGAGLFTCEVITAPTLTALNAWYDDQAGRLAVEFIGVDPERDVAAPGVTLLDTNGVDIVVRADGMVGEAMGTFEPVEYGEAGAYRALWLYSLRDEAGLAPALGSVRARVRDAEGLVSPPLDTTPAPTTRGVIEGESCDPFGARTTCAPDLICDAPPAASATCQSPVLECPEAWGAVALTVVDGGATHSGTTLDAESHGVGTCGGGAGDVAHVFTAPAAGRYTATVTSPDADADTVLYARSACSYSAAVQPTLEVDCNDDETEMSLLSALVLTLEAGQTVYLFVDGYRAPTGEGWRGDYTLNVAQAN